MIKLPPDSLESLTVGKTIDGRLPCAIVDTAALTVEDGHTHTHKGRQYGGKGDRMNRNREEDESG